MVFGIQNIGATCYLNSAIQVIHSCPILLEKIGPGAIRDVNIPEIISMIKFPIGTPHDAYEAFLAMVEHIPHDDDTIYGTSETTIINRDGSKSLIKDTFSALIFPNNLSIEDLTRCEYVCTENNTFVYRQTTFTKFPKVVACVFPNAKNIDIPDEFLNRKLNCIVCLTGGHYFSVVGNHIIDDDKIYTFDGNRNALPIYMAVYSDG